MASRNAAWVHGTYKQGGWKHGPRGTLDRCWTSCACGSWVWDADKPSECERCGRSFGEKQAVQTRASGVHRRATAIDVIPEGEHSSLLAILRAAGGQLGFDLQSMLGTLLLDKATLEHRETESFRAVKGWRIAASKARAIKDRC